MAKQRKVNRRTFIGAAAGAAGATALSPLGPSLSLGHDKDMAQGRPARPARPSRAPAVRDPRLDHPARQVRHGEPRRTGVPGQRSRHRPDSSPLPGGFAAVFEYLASVGYTGFEFFSFSNGANPAMTPAQIRTALDNAGLKAAGTHTGGLAAMSDPVNGAANRQAQIDMAGILGYKMIGTAGNPANPTLGHARRVEGLRGAGEHGRRRVPRRRASSTSSTPSRTGSASSPTRRTPSSTACTGSTGSPTTRTASSCTSSPTRCTRSPAARASPTPSTGVCST